MDYDDLDDMYASNDLIDRNDTHDFSNDENNNH